MGDAGPPESGLDAWLPKGKHDIYAIGVQVRESRLLCHYFAPTHSVPCRSASTAAPLQLLCHLCKVLRACSPIRFSSRYLPKNGASSVEIDFFETLTQHLGDTYVKLAGMSLLTIRLAVFVRREHYYKISHLKVP
jgi:hypothetical protein